MAPGNNETGGTARPAKTRKDNRYLRRILVQAGHAAARKRYSRALAALGKLLKEKLA